MILWSDLILVLLSDVIRVIMMPSSYSTDNRRSNQKINEAAQLVYKRVDLLLKGNITMDNNEFASVGLLYRLIEHLFVFSAEARGASQRCWPSRLTLRSHLLFSCSPAEGSSRRAVPSGEPRASVPNKASPVERCTPPCPATPPRPHLGVHLYIHKTLSNIRIQHSLKPTKTTERPEGRSYRSRHPVFLFIQLLIHLFPIFYSLTWGERRKRRFLMTMHRSLSL